MAKKSEEWFSQVLTVDQTHIFTPEQLQNELAELQSEHGEAYGRALWLQEYYCSFEAALPGSIFGEGVAKAEMEGRITSVKHEEGYPVFTAMDLGRSDANPVWFYQMIGDEVRIIDFWESNFKEIPEIADMLRHKKSEYGYQYGIHWLPHDAKPKRLGMGGKSILQQFLDQNIGRFACVPNLSREDGIQAARATLRRCYVDSEKCFTGIEHLKSYRRKYDDAKKSFSQTPEHDEHSHAADAFRYLSLSWQEAKEVAPELTQAQKFKAGNIVGQTFGSIKKQFLDKKRRMRENAYS